MVGVEQTNGKSAENLSNCINYNNLNKDMTSLVTDIPRVLCWTNN